MKAKIRLIGHLCFCLLLVAVTAGTGSAQPTPGQPAPLFVLKDPQGKAFELSSMKDQPMVVVYFFDIKSHSSQEGLLHLDQLAKTYADSDLIVWGVTRSDKGSVQKFLTRTKIGFPILIDKGNVSDAYAARLVLPTVCIVGPDLKLLDYFQGGGKNTEAMLVTLAERQLQRRNIKVAKAISDDVVRKDPQNVRAKTVKGYAELKGGDLKAAEKTFYNLSRAKGEGEILGKEGLSNVYAQKGEPAKAMQMAKEVESKDRQRAFAQVVQGDLLYSQNKTREAEKAYRKAIENKEGPSAHKAVAYNQLGRIYALRGKYSQSREMYDRAVALDPYYVEATSNKGMTFERQGEWSKALESYRRAQSINKNDPFAPTLAAHAQKMMLLEKDPERRRKFDQQVEMIANNYKEGIQSGQDNPQDPWTSGPMVLTMLEPLESGGLSKRAGFGRVLTFQVADQLNASGRVKVIDPLVVERVMKKVGLKKSELSDQAVQIRLAKAMGASLIAKGTLYHLMEGTLMQLKLEDIANQEKTTNIERQFASAATLKMDLHWLNREMLSTIMAQHPLRGFAVEVTGNQVLMNLGASQGVVSGALFDVVEEKPPVNYKGKIFIPEPAVMATVEVVRVEPDFAYAHIKEQRRPIKADDKLRESAQNISKDTKKVW
ncbi:MAG: tetratricopeptide repeat protein [Desulfosarcinaceae bacterium]